VVSESISIHKTFLDTIGRPTLHLTAINLSDDHRDRDVIVTYDYPWTSGFRKPVTIFAGMVAVFVAAWVIGSLDLSIGKKKIDQAVGGKKIR
jgi:oligosaccharyltransferase complex subunit alpha (ribophorin I)